MSELKSDYSVKTNDGGLCVGHDPFAYRDVLGNLDAFEPATDMPLDSGIRRYVLILRGEGVETFQSCQGGEGHALPEPTISFYGNAWEGYRVFALAMTYGLPVLEVRRTYGVNDGELQQPCWDIVFRKADTGD